MSGIVWLASYPKSGNTWFRVFVANLLANGTEPVNVNDLRTDGIASGRDIFGDFTGIEASDLTPEEIDLLRPEIYEYMGAASEETLFLKVHDAYTRLPNGRPLIPAATARAIYIIRNPLDVAVSFSHHVSCGIDTVISWMEDRACCLYDEPNELPEQLRQKLLDWSGHVESWVDAPGLKVHVIRYEDMETKPLETFTRAAGFAGLSCDERQVRRAVQFSDFRILQQQEEHKGFQEKPAGMSKFFRQGQVGGWRDHLTAEQVNRIVRAHGEVMKRFGYSAGKRPG